MEKKIVELLERVIVLLEKQNGIPIWEIIINIIPWIGVIITLGMLFIERHETRRPYLEISFELIRSTMACIVIRNVGNVPAKLESLKFNSEFISQLNKAKMELLEGKKEMDVKIFPKRYWVLSLDKNIFEVIQFKNTELKVEYTYSKINACKKYVEETEIDFREYGSFLLYLSEVDELKSMTEKKLTEITKLCDDMTKYLAQMNENNKINS